MMSETSPWLKFLLSVFFVVMLAGVLDFMIFVLPEIAKGNKYAIADNQLVTVFLAMFTALFIVLFLPLYAGPIKFGIAGFNFEGAAGPIVLWVLVFSVVMVFGFSPPWGESHPLEYPPSEESTELRSPGAAGAAPQSEVGTD